MATRPTLPFLLTDLLRPGARPSGSHARAAEPWARPAATDHDGALPGGPLLLQEA